MAALVLVYGRQITFHLPYTLPPPPLYNPPFIHLKIYPTPSKTRIKMTRHVVLIVALIKVQHLVNKCQNANFYPNGGILNFEVDAVTVEHK